MHFSELPEGEARPFWDGGLEKIEVWVKLHICNHYCRALDLPQLPPPTQNEADSNKDISEPSGSGLKKQQAKPQKKGQKRKTSPSAQVERPVTRSTTGSTPNRWFFISLSSPTCFRVSKQLNLLFFLSFSILWLPYPLSLFVKMPNKCDSTPQQLLRLEQLALPLI